MVQSYLASMASSLHHFQNMLPTRNQIRFSSRDYHCKLIQSNKTEKYTCQQRLDWIMARKMSKVKFANLGFDDNSSKKKFETI